MNECAIVLPTEEDKWLNFNNYERKERVPFVVYNLECALERKEERKTLNMSIVQHYKAYSVGYYARCAFDDIKSMYRLHRDEKCVICPGTAKSSASRERYFEHHRASIASYSRRTGEIPRHDELTRVRETVRVGRRSRPRTPSFDRAVQRSCAF
ncbi:hypothetical protein ACFW04_014773 [Cataglyphis niger]